jgi:ABC-type glycerol-3-phosphate transport system permease component
VERHDRAGRLAVEPGPVPRDPGHLQLLRLQPSQWTLLATAIVIASLPLVILFAASQRQLIRASAAGSVKG